MPDEFYKNLIKHMLDFDFQGRDNLKTQFAHMTVVHDVDNNQDGSGVRKISVAGGDPAIVDSRQPIELESRDADGITIAALLFVDDGKLHLIDIYKLDGSPIKKMPEPNSFKLTYWEKLDDSTQVRKVT